MTVRLPLPFRHPAMFLATWFGSGLLPKAPGTWGSLAALPFAWLIIAGFGWPGLALATVAIFLVGWWAAERYVSASGIADPGAVVIDEVAGQWLTLLAAPAGFWQFTAGFALFRLFDITKPWPVSWADRRLPGGFGVMADDILAGLYALACLSFLEWVAAR